MAKAKRYRLVLTDEEQSSEIEVWSFDAGEETKHTACEIDLEGVVEMHEEREYGTAQGWLEDLDGAIDHLNKAVIAMAYVIAEHPSRVKYGN